jgi:hypothetical protein
MRYTNAGFIGSGAIPKQSGEVDGIWRYFTDINKALVSSQWYKSTVPQNISISPDIIYEEIGNNVVVSGFFTNDTVGFSESFQWEKSSNLSLWTGIAGATGQNYSFSINDNEYNMYLRLKIFRGFKSGISSDTTTVSGLAIGFNTISIDSESPYDGNPSSTGITPAFCSVNMSLTASTTQNSNYPTLNFGPKYQWQKKESGSLSFSDIAEQTSTSLSLSNIFYDNDNQDMYRCVVTAKAAVSITGTTYVINAQQSAAEPIIPQTTGSLAFGIYFDWGDIDTSNGYVISDHDFIWQSGDNTVWSSDNSITSIGSFSNYFFTKSLYNGVYYRAKIRAKGQNNLGCSWTSNYGSFSDPIQYTS